MAGILIGTSGWMYRDWQGVFYPTNLPQNRQLEYYSQNFKTVEVNATFYHQMRPETAKTWSGKVPDDFVFAVKANRFITHIKRLRDCREPLRRFLEQVKGLGNNLGPILFQLPPHQKEDKQRLNSFLNELRTLNSELRVVFEFRNESWFKPEISKILERFGIGLVINDSPHFPKTEKITANFTYIRFHGPSALYSSEYSNSELEFWAAKIKKWAKSGLEIFAYFNNDVAGFAVTNATTLIGMLDN